MTVMTVGSVAPERYLLSKPFSMPTVHGSVAAISVTTKAGQTLQSLYTLMLHTILVQVWILIVVFVMTITARRRTLTHNMAIANVAIWNSKSSPGSIAWSMLDYIHHIPHYAVMWAALALIALSSQVLLSTFVAPHLIVGQAAPVNPRAVFIPPISSGLDEVEVILSNIVTAPADFRAMDSLEALDPLTGGDVNIFNTTNTAVQFNGGQIALMNDSLPVHQFNYSYWVTGVDFGLQHAPSLNHTVQGSCYTEYQWFQGSTNATGTPEDIYLIPCSPEAATCETNYTVVTASTTDSKPPSVSVYNVSPPDFNNSTYSTNYTFAFVISSVNRTSFTESTDPWYLTTPYTSANGISENRVVDGRPALFCWQQDTWSYKGKTRSSIALDELGALSLGLLNITRTFLNGPPKIVSLATGLGVSALKTTTAGDLGYHFDASTSNVKTDLQRLVYASYIATKNTFGETTVSNHAQYPTIRNGLVYETNNSLIEGTGDFVVFGAGFSALSLSFLVSVPIILVMVFLIVYLLRTNRWVHWPWGEFNAMNATILYSAIDSKNFRGEEDVAWKRSSTSPYYPTKENALVRPTYHRGDRSYGWTSASSQ
jgi:hypothetical protein